MNENRRHLYAVLATATLLVIGGTALAADKYVEEFPAEAGGSIKLEMDHGGSVIAEGWDRDLVRITASDRSNDLDVYDIDVTETRNGLKFTADINDRRINNTSLRVRIMVPAEFDIEIKSAGGGIDITGITGTFTGRSGGGGITLTDVKGEARLTTGGGGIEVSDCELDGKVSTGGGGATVRDVVGNVKVTSGGGVVSYENVRDRDGDRRLPGGLKTRGLEITADTLVYSTAGGGIDIDEAPAGAVVRTGGGAIEIRGAEAFVRANTGGGDIEIEIGDGSVIASTGAGDVEIVVEDGLGDGDDGISLSSGHGDITLVIPRGLSIEVDLDLSYTRNSTRDFEIISDLDLDLEHTRKWDYDHGSPRKHIYGTATIGGGEHRLKIRTTNGNIRIRVK